MQSLAERGGLLASSLGNAAHLWAVSVHEPPLGWETLRSVLTEEERAYASRFRQSADQLRSILARGILRLVLGRHLEVEPERIQLSRSQNGKPELAGSLAGAIEFNVSHAGGWVLVGLTRGGRIGVDVEQLREVADHGEIAARFFAPEEARAIEALPEEERRCEFLAYWTCKEAYLKALGTGLGTEMNTFAVRFGGERPKLVCVGGGGAVRSADWTIWTGSPEPGYMAAAAIHAPDVDIRANCWTASGLHPWFSSTLSADSLLNRTASRRTARSQENGPFRGC